MDQQRWAPAGRRPTTPRRVRKAWLAGGVGVVMATFGLAAVGQQAAVGAPHAAPADPAPTFAASYLNGVSGPRPERSVSLAGEWGFTPITNTVCTGGGPFGTTTGPFLSCVDSPASGEQTTIQVPGGGWVKQGYIDLSEALYTRTIRVPNIPNDQVTLLDFGAINHKATLWVDGQEVGTQVTSYTSSVFDISDYVRPGKTAEIKVLVQGRKALVGPDNRYTVAEGASWSDDPAQGIFRSADLEVFPAVYVSDTVVRTSVGDRQLSYDVYLTNATDRAQQATLSGELDSANGANWKYPSIGSQRVMVPADQTIKVTVGPLAWRAGSDSYWWPNVPYRAGYRAQLHDLVVELDPREPAMQSSTSDVRFGFRETKQVGDHFELNGARVNFRGDSLQGVNYDNIDFHGRSDAYDTFPGFLKPSKSNAGWPKAVDNYLRLNYSGVRIHQIPATPYMLDVADEMGLMIQDETAIRGSNNRENFITGRDNMLKHLADLVKRDRNHASVLRWSQANEPRVVFFNNPGAGPEFDEALYQTVMALDQTRPISTDGDSADLPHANYTVFCHYDNFSFGAYTESICAGPAGKPQGQGEFIWWVDSTPQGMTWFATASMRMREQGASDTRPYTLLSTLGLGHPRREADGHDARVRLPQRSSSDLRRGQPARPLGESDHPTHPKRVQSRRGHRQRLLERQQDVGRRWHLADDALNDRPRADHPTADHVQRHLRGRAALAHLEPARRQPGRDGRRQRQPDPGHRTGGKGDRAAHVHRTRCRPGPLPGTERQQARAWRALPRRKHRLLGAGDRLVHRVLH